MSDLFDSLIQEENKDIANSGGDIFDSLTIELPQQQPTEPQTTMQDVVSGLGGLSLLAGTGYGIKKGYDWYRKPWVERNALIKPLKIQQQELGLEGRLIDMPSQIKTKISVANETLKSQLSNVDKLAGIEAQTASDIIIKNKSQWEQSGYKAYRQGLDSLDSKTDFGRSAFKEQVLKKAIDSSIVEGVPENSLKSLKLLYDEIKPEGKMPFSQAKGYFNSSIDKLPPKAQYQLADKWGDFASKNLPQESLGEFGQLQNNYKEFAKVRNKLSQMIDPKTQELSPNKLNKYFMDNAKSNLDNGVKQLIDYLNQDNAIAKKMEGLKPSSGKLQNLRVQRAILTQKTADLVTNLKTKTLPQVETQLSKIKQKQARIDARSVINKSHWTRNLVGKGFNALSTGIFLNDIYQQVKEIRNDPLIWQGKQVGISVPPPDSPENIERRRMIRFLMRGGT